MEAFAGKGALSAALTAKGFSGCGSPAPVDAGPFGRTDSDWQSHSHGKTLKMECDSGSLLPIVPRISFEIEQNAKHDILSTEGFIILILMILRCKEGVGTVAFAVVENHTRMSSKTLRGIVDRIAENRKC